MTGRADLSADSGSGSTPRNGAESIGTDTAASPMPASCWVIRPPKEWPMTAGWSCRAAMTSAMCSVTCPTLLPAKTSGFARASATVPGSSGQPGATVAWPFSSKNDRHGCQLEASIHSPCTKTTGCRPEAFAWPTSRVSLMVRLTGVPPFEMEAKPAGPHDRRITGGWTVLLSFILTDSEPEVDVPEDTTSGSGLSWRTMCSLEPTRIRSCGCDGHGYCWSVRQSPEDDVGVQVARLGAEVRQRADELADGLVARIRAAVPAYRTDAVISAGELRRVCLDNIDFVFGPIGRTPAVASPESRENGRQRAKGGVPLTAVMEAYRVAARYLWDCLAETAARQSVSAEVTLRAAAEMWLVQDTFTQEMADGYREEITSQVLGQEQERSALVEALLEGRLADASLWDAADILRLPLRGPYVVIAAQAPGIGRLALPRVQAALQSIGVISAWRLLHDAEVGIAWLPGPP